MRRNHELWLALVMMGCQPSAPTDTVESLAANPERLKEVQRQCRLDRANAGDAVCSAASESYRRRFMGSGKARDARDALSESPVGEKQE